MMWLELRGSEIPNAGKGMFTTVLLGNFHEIAIHYGTLVLENIFDIASSCPAVYSEGALVVPPDILINCGMELEFEKPSGCPIGVFPSPFFPARFRNDPRSKTAEERLPALKKLVSLPSS